jgi:hypothetical protein
VGIPGSLPGPPGTTGPHPHLTRHVAGTLVTPGGLPDRQRDDGGQVDSGVNGTYRVGRPSAQRQRADGRRYLHSAARRRPAAWSCLSERHAYPWPSGLASRWRPRSCSCTELVRATRCQAQRGAPPRPSRPRSRGGNYSGTRRAGAHLVVVHDAVPRAHPAGRFSGQDVAGSGACRNR